jgi:Domain of Unknown Function (DUF1080)
MMTDFKRVVLRRIVAAGIAVLSSSVVAAEKTPVLTITDAAKGGPDFAVQGEYTGKFRDEAFGIQVVALGRGEFDAVLCAGGLPGAGWTGTPNPRQQVRGKREGDAADGPVKFTGNGWTATAGGGTIKIKDVKEQEIGALSKIERKSPTAGLAPPAGAIVLFDGGSLERFKPGARKTDDGLLMEGCTSVEEFGDCTVHIEFRLPFQPESRGQGRGNSGMYLAGRYEVQMLDSFGLKGANNECGGIYTVAKPRMNMCLPPLQWQTYDVEFKAPRFDEKGGKTADAEITVRHNGELIHENVKIPKPTAAAISSTEAPRGPLHLQNHGNPVRYRNVWVLPKN